MGEDHVHESMRGLIENFWTTQAIYAATRLGLPELLRAGPRSCDVLASESGAHRGALCRLMAALATVGVVVEREPHLFELSPMGRRLCQGPDALDGWAITVGEVVWSTWGELLHSVRTGESAFQKVHGVSRYDYLDRDPEAAGRFDASMALFSRAAAAAIVAGFDFSSCEELVDVGGGTGELLLTILGRHPALRGTVFERARLQRAAEEAILAADLAGRCRFVAGDFRLHVPAGASAYILKDVLHNWSDDDAVGILRNCRESMPPDGRVLVIEALRPGGPEAATKGFLDLHMLVMHGGLRRGEEELRELFGAAGLRLSRVVPTAGPSIVEGVPAAT
jgi:SAM-dependent methyltransferase